jgi:hypothetical protein
MRARMLVCDCIHECIYIYVYIYIYIYIGGEAFLKRQNISGRKSMCTRIMAMERSLAIMLLVMERAYALK